VDAAGEADYNTYVQTCQSLSIYDTGVTPAYGEKLITLSTCEYSQTNGRLVVVARCID
jgi:sortase B